jgi:hydrogenase expression/formation protein HypD
VIAAILQSKANRVQAFLGPGHVCAVMGFREYDALSRRYRVPIVVTGFEPLDLLEGILMTVRQLEQGRAEVENQYARAVAPGGNPSARELVAEVFEIADRKWRGVGSIPKSGYRLAPEFRAHDAERIFEVDDIATSESPLCISGQILRGLRKPSDCPAFGRECTPQSPLGATMVSAEGACAAYYAYGRHLERDGFGTRAPAPAEGTGAVAAGTP